MRQPRCKPSLAGIQSPCSFLSFPLTALLLDSAQCFLSGLPFPPAHASVLREWARIPTASFSLPQGGLRPGAAQGPELIMDAPSAWQLHLDSQLDQPPVTHQTPVPAGHLQSRPRMTAVLTSTSPTSPFTILVLSFFTYKVGIKSSTYSSSSCADQMRSQM